LRHRPASRPVRPPRLPGARAGLTLHHFTRGEAERLLGGAGFRLIEVKPIGVRAGGGITPARLASWLRAYGYLLAAERPES
jgi:hypothetical protein